MNIKKIDLYLQNNKFGEIQNKNISSKTSCLHTKPITINNNIYDYVTFSGSKIPPKQPTDAQDTKSSQPSIAKIFGNVKKMFGMDLNTEKTVQRIVSEKSPEIKQTKKNNKLYDQIQDQLDITSVMEIEEMVDEITSQSGAKREESIFALQTLTQYGNISNIEKMINKYKCRCYNNSGLSLNSALNYLGMKKYQIKMPDDLKINFFLDDSGLKYLEGLSELLLDELIDDERINFVVLEGWNKGLNFYNQGIDKNEITNNAIELIKEAKKMQAQGLSFKKAFIEVADKETIERAHKLGIYNYDKASLIDYSTKISTSEIQKNLAPLNIDMENVHTTISIIGNEFFPNDKAKAKRAKELIIEYLEAETDIYSQKRLGKQMQKMHELIKKTVSGLKKSDGENFSANDIVYLIPSSGKSYEQIALQYSMVNKIDPSKFKYGNIKDVEISQNDKVYVVLDDIVGSGASMLDEYGGLRYSAMSTKCMVNKHIIIAPIVAGEFGYRKIAEEIKNIGRAGKDFILIDSAQIRKPYKETDFYKNLNVEDKEMLNQILLDIGEKCEVSALGYGDKPAYAIAFPYMFPDNDAALSSLIFEDLLLNPFSIQAVKNRYSERNTHISSIIRQRQKAISGRNQKMLHDLNTENKISD